MGNFGVWIWEENHRFSNTFCRNIGHLAYFQIRPKAKPGCLTRAVQNGRRFSCSGYTHCWNTLSCFFLLSMHYSYVLKPIPLVRSSSWRSQQPNERKLTFYLQKRLSMAFQHCPQRSNIGNAEIFTSVIKLFAVSVLKAMLQRVQETHFLEAPDRKHLW